MHAVAKVSVWRAHHAGAVIVLDALNGGFSREACINRFAKAGVPAADVAARRPASDAPPRPSSPSLMPEARTRAAPPQAEGQKRNAAAEAVSLSTAPGAARALAAASKTLAELKTAITNFDGCELKRYATNTVFADGSVHFLRDNIGIRIFAKLVTRAGDELISTGDF